MQCFPQCLAETLPLLGSNSCAPGGRGRWQGDWHPDHLSCTSLAERLIQRDQPRPISKVLMNIDLAVLIAVMLAS